VDSYLDTTKSSATIFRQLAVGFWIGPIFPKGQLSRQLNA